MKIRLPLSYHGHRTDLVAVIDTEDVDRSLDVPPDPADHDATCPCVACDLIRQAKRRVGSQHQ